MHVNTFGEIHAQHKLFHPRNTVCSKKIIQNIRRRKKNIIFIYNIHFVYVFTDLKTFHRLPILFGVMTTVWQNV